MITIKDTLLWILDPCSAKPGLKDIYLHIDASRKDFTRKHPHWSTLFGDPSA